MLDSLIFQIISADLSSNSLLSSVPPSVTTITQEMNNEEEEDDEQETKLPLFTVFPSASAQHVVTQELLDDPVSVAVTTEKMTDDQDFRKEPNRKKRIRLDANHSGTIGREDN
jgi:hypothetical protein